MNRLFVIIVLTNVTWLANAAALEPANQQIAQQPATKKFDRLFDEDMLKELRADILELAKPELLEFLMRRHNDKACQKIPNFGQLVHAFAISEKYSQLVICPRHAAEWRNREMRGQIIIWNLESNELQRIIDLPHPIMRALMTPDGETLIVIDKEGDVTIWDMKNLEKKRDLGVCCHSYRFYAALNVDGSKLVTVQGYDNYSVRVWDVQTGKALSENITVGQPHDMIEFVALSSDGSKVAINCSNSYCIRTVDITGHVFPVINNINPGYLQFRPDGNSITCYFMNHDRETDACAFNIVDGTLLYHLAPGYTRIIGSKRIDFQKSCTNMCFALFDDCSGRFLCTIYPETSYNHPFWDFEWCYAVTNNWAVATVDNGNTICVWNLKQLMHQSNELQQALGLLSPRQLWLLIHKIMPAAAKCKKLKLDGNNPKMVEMIADFKSLPSPIFKRVKDCVKLMNVDKEF